MEDSTQFQSQIVGALPAITHSFDQLDLAGTVDRVVPWEGEIPLGTLVEILIANRLLRPKALFRIGTWAQSAAVTDYYGLTVEHSTMIGLAGPWNGLPSTPTRFKPRWCSRPSIVSGSTCIRFTTISSMSSDTAPTRSS